MTDAATAPATPEAAQAKLNELTADKAWGDRLVANDATARGEFEMLTRVIAGTSESLAAATTAANDDRHLAEFTKGVRDQFPVEDAVLKQIAADAPVSKADKELGVQWLQQLANDPDRSAKLMRGDLETKRQFFHASVLASSEVKDGTASTFSAADILKIGQNQTRDLAKDL